MQKIRIFLNNHAVFPERVILLIIYLIFISIPRFSKEITSKDSSNFFEFKIQEFVKGGYLCSIRLPSPRLFVKNLKSLVFNSF